MQVSIPSFHILINTLSRSGAPLGMPDRMSAWLDGPWITGGGSAHRLKVLPSSVFGIWFAPPHAGGCRRSPAFWRQALASKGGAALASGNEIPREIDPADQCGRDIEGAGVSCCSAGRGSSMEAEAVPGRPAEAIVKTLSAVRPAEATEEPSPVPSGEDVSLLSQSSTVLSTHKFERDVAGHPA